jgi:cold shock CspA family protein
MDKKYGIVKRWMENGYGFLVSDGIERDIYFHARDWRSAESPVVGQRIMFELVDARIPGKPPQATNVHAIHAALNVEAGVRVLASGSKYPIKEDAAEMIDISPEIGALSIKGGVE